MQQQQQQKASLPFGGWPSQITADLITAGSISRDYPCKVGNTLYWQESRPAEQGRTTIVARSDDGSIRDVLPYPISTQSRVHEYGGKSWLLDGNDLYYVDKSDQRLYHTVLSDVLSDTGNGFHATPLTPENGGWRFADFSLDRQRNRLIGVCELHSEELNEPANFLIDIPLDGSGSTTDNLEILISGHDFYAYPRLSPNGQQLCWIAWNHPRMPWDGTELYCAELEDSGGISELVQVAGGEDESIFQPEWSPNGQLCFVSDRSGWWNLYLRNSSGDIRQVLARNAEFATPLWSLGMSTYGFISAHRIAALNTAGGQWQLTIIDTDTGNHEPRETPCGEMHSLYCFADGEIFFTGATASSSSDIFAVPLREQAAVRITDSTPNINSETISSPQPIQFPTTDGDSAFGFYYTPANAEFTGESNTLPPLIVMCHGGPTGASYGVLNYKVQYWTSRGFAVLDVNYRGSTGYGRAFRQKIHQRWGLVDVDDAEAGVEFLASKQLIDANRAIIRGSSAGGYTVLAALTFTQTFKAGASLYGIGDLEALARDTHKFESRYLDSLVGPYPDIIETYQERSPIFHQEKLSCPVIFLQGLEDNVVPPNQAETMVAALDAKNIPVAYVTFADEGHGFRKAENIKKALEAELYFYRAVLKITSPEELPPIPIRNLR